MTYTILDSEKAINFEGPFTENIFIELSSKIKKQDTYVFDFSKVPSINYSGVRTLILLKNAGYKFKLENINEDVTSFLKGTRFIDDKNFSDELIEITLDDYKQSGDGFTSVTYFKNDGDSMLKLYYPFVSIDAIKEEKRRANETLLMGIETPLCGELVKVGESHGLTFERIQNKKSIARLLSENVNASQQLGKEMADFSLILHKTVADPSLFPNKKKQIIQDINEFQGLTEEERNKILKWLENVPDSNNSLHGDFHIGNVIKTNTNNLYFIDMGDFACGYYYFDLGDLYFNMYNPLEDAGRRLYHCEPEVLKQFWRDFAKEYLHLDSSKEIDDASNEAKKFGALSLIHYAKRVRVEEWMKALISDWLLNNI